MSENFDAEKRMEFVESNIDVGIIVAFRLPDGKVKSAKVVNKSTKGKKLKVETSYGAEFVIQYSDVVWVKTKGRWPRGVYNLLKGITDGEG